MRIDLDKLKSTNPRLYRTVTKKLDLGKAFGEQEVDAGSYSDYTRGELTAWLAAQKTVQPKVVELPPPAPVEKPAEPEDDSELRQRAVDEAEGTARIEFYVREGRLEDNSANGALIIEYIKAHGGRWTAAIVDAAIKALGNQLIWKPKVVEPAPSAPLAASPEPVEARTLKDGSKQLALDVVPNRTHTTEQLRDWLSRTRK
jgi:hypothetical protein